MHRRQRIVDVGAAGAHLGTMGRPQGLPGEVLAGHTQAAGRGSHRSATCRGPGHQHEHEHGVELAAGLHDAGDGPHEERDPVGLRQVGVGGAEGARKQEGQARHAIPRERREPHPDRVDGILVGGTAHHLGEQVFRTGHLLQILQQAVQAGQVGVGQLALVEKEPAGEEVGAEAPRPASVVVQHRADRSARGWAASLSGGAERAESVLQEEVTDPERQDAAGGRPDVRLHDHSSAHPWLSVSNQQLHISPPRDVARRWPCIDGRPAHRPQPRPDFGGRRSTMAARYNSFRCRVK